MSQMRDHVTPQSVQSSRGLGPLIWFSGGPVTLCWCCCNMFLRHLTGFLSFSRRHGRTSMGALEGTSDTNLREMRVSTSLPSNFHAFSIPFRNSTRGSSSLLIPISSLRRIKNLFPSVIFKHFLLMSCYANNFLSFRTSNMTRLSQEKNLARPSHQTRKPFYITSRRQINPVLRENYASESH